MWVLYFFTHFDDVHFKKLTKRNSHGQHVKLNLGTLSEDDDYDGSENVGNKMNLRSFKLDRIYLDPLNIITLFISIALLSYVQGA